MLEVCACNTFFLSEMENPDLCACLIRQMGVGMKDGYIRVSAATPKVQVADVEYNKGEILRLIKEAHKEGTELLVFPEL